MLYQQIYDDTLTKKLDWNIGPLLIWFRKWTHKALQWHWQSSVDVFQNRSNACLSMCMFVDPHLTSHHSIYILSVRLRKVSAKHPPALNNTLNVSLTMDLFSFHCGVAVCYGSHIPMLTHAWKSDILMLKPNKLTFSEDIHGALVKGRHESEFVDCHHRRLKF